MTIKEILKIASDDRLMFFMKTLNESFQNDVSRTKYEIKTEEKERRTMAKTIKEKLS